MKALLLSVRPEHAFYILQGKKMRELRKSVPKGFKGWAYVYVTEGKPRLSVVHDDENGKTYYYLNSNWGRELNGTIPFRFWFDEYEEVLTQHHIDSEQIDRILKQACIEHDDLDKYVGNKETIYAWHIKNLDPFYKPMQLGEFTTTPIPNNAIIEKSGEGMPYFYVKERCSWHMYFSYLTKAPQSYMYVYVKEEV